MNKVIKSLACLLLLSTAAMAQREGLVRKSNGDELTIPRRANIAVDKNGGISFRDPRGETITLKRREYTYISTEMPPSVKKVERAFKAMQYQAVVDEANKTPAMFYWLGWGGLISYFKAVSLVRLGQHDEAMKAVREALIKYARHENRRELLTRAQTEIKVAQGGSAPGGKPDSFNLMCNGIVLERKGDITGAALNYMKAVLLFDDLKNEEDFIPQMSACARLVTMLEKLKDGSTAGYFKEYLKNL